jgi:hypothetical protein
MNEQIREIRGRFLRSSASEWQQGNITSLLDRQRQPSLMRCANPSQPPRDNSPALRHELRQQTNVLIVDRLDLFDAELANFLAPEILAPTGAATLATTARSTRTRRRTPLAAIRPVAAGR